MKSIFAVLAIATSLSALACPQLTGVYQCQQYVDGVVQEGEGSTLHIGQLNLAGQERFVVETEYDDSSLRTELLTVGMANEQGATATCRGNSLRITEGNDIETIAKNGNQIVITFNGKIESNCTSLIQ
jgi:hypothetical protein